MNLLHPILARIFSDLHPRPTIDTLLRFPLRILIIVLIASAVIFPTDRRNLPLEHNRFPPQKRARVHFIPDLEVGVFVTLRAPDVMKVLPGALSGRLLSIPAPRPGKTIDPVRYQDERATEQTPPRPIRRVGEVASHRGGGIRLHIPALLLWRRQHWIQLSCLMLQEHCLCRSRHWLVWDYLT